MKKLEIDKIHKQLRPVWKKHFKKMMTYEQYFEQILRYNILPYVLFKKVDKKLFMNYKNKTIKVTLDALEEKRKNLGIGTSFDFGYED